MKADRSGIQVEAWHLPLIFGMLKRGDRKHDIAAWFGLNQGRIKNAVDGKYGIAPPAPERDLPPAGSPGPRATELRGAVDRVRQLLKNGDVRGAISALDSACAEFDKNV